MLFGSRAQRARVQPARAPARTAAVSTQRTLGVIGGSGLYALEGLEDVEELHVETTFGAPSDAIVRGRLGDTTLLFLPRHGRGHRVPPHQVNYRANILALKMSGAEQVLSVSAVGSMKEALPPGHLVVVGDYIDRTRHRPDTFFEDTGVVAHVSLAHPVDAALSDIVYEAAREVGADVQKGGTYLCVEGPQFSTLAESRLYRTWGVDVIGMTNLPEARLAREAELPYASLAMVTDFDCWHPDHDAVTLEAVLEVMQKNVHAAKKILPLVAARLPDPSESPASSALATSIITDRSLITDEARAKLAPLAGNYL